MRLRTARKILKSAYAGMRLKWKRRTCRTAACYVLDCSHRYRVSHGGYRVVAAKSK